MPTRERPVNRTPRTPNTGLGVPRTARLEVAAERSSSARGLGEPELEIHPLLGAEVVRAERLAGDAGEPLAELVQPVAPDGESRGHLVPAEALEQIAAGEQRRVEVEPRDAPPRSLADVAVEGDEERRPAVALDHPRRDDAHHARVPSFAREHEPGVPLGIARLLDLRQRLVEDALVERLALDVEPLEPAGERGGLGRVVGEQQPKPVGRVADPSGRVEPGTEDEAHVSGAELPSRRGRWPR